MFNYVTKHRIFFNQASLKWLNEPQDTHVKQGQDVAIPCAANGYPEPSIIWSKVNSEEDYSNYDSNLRIFRASPKHIGRYECIAKNSAGEKLSKIISISVFGEQSNFCATFCTKVETNVWRCWEALFEIIYLLLSKFVVFAECDNSHDVCKVGCVVCNNWEFESCFLW